MGSTVSSSSGSIGVALDVDGMLVRGGTVLPGASAALKLVEGGLEVERRENA